MAPRLFGSRRLDSLRSGFTLLEVVLALAILAASLAMLGQLIGLGFRSAQQAQGLTEAQMIAETVMENIAVGILPPDPVQDMNISMTTDLSATLTTETDTPWVYSIDWQPAPMEGLIIVMVQVRRANVESAAQNDQFQLVRWMRDPQLALELMPESSSAAPPEAPPLGSANRF